MKKESILYSIIGLLSGAIIAGSAAAYAVNNNNNGIMRFMGMRTSFSQNMIGDNNVTMDRMTVSLQDKSGDQFDNAFLAGMISHHEGAIEMAKLAQANAKHEEVKTLANDILAAQSKEIDMMQLWQTQWGYKTTTSIQSHDMMNSSH